jgi:hypothetical protein
MKEMKGSGDENKLSRRKQRNMVGYKWEKVYPICQILDT